MEHKSLSSLLAPNPAFGISVVNVKHIPPSTAEDIEEEKNPEAYDRRILAEAWKEERTEFNQLERLARAIGIESMIVSRYAAFPTFHGVYIPSEICQWDFNNANQWALQWGLSKSQIRAIKNRAGAVILIEYRSCLDPGTCRTLAHEIGHHLYRLTKFTKEEQSIRVTKTMEGFFRFDSYVHQSRDEICAECFAKYLSVPTIKIGIRRHCDSILRKVRVHNPNPAKLIESYRRQRVLKY
jgi:hypothetical protein